MYSYESVIKCFVPIALPGATAADHAEIAKTLIEQQSGDNGGDEWPDNISISAAIWNLISVGIVYPRLRRIAQDGYPTVIENLILCPSADNLLAEDFHPLHPEFLNRLRLRWTSIPDEPAARFADAAACLERGLTRAAIVMIGLASEEVIREAHSRVVTGKALRHVTLRDRLDDLDAVVKKIPKTDDQHVLRAALSAIEVIRVERNRASHPGAVFSDPILAEELILSAAHHLAEIWDRWVAGK